MIEAEDELKQASLGNDLRGSRSPYAYLESLKRVAKALDP